MLENRLWQWLPTALMMVIPLIIIAVLVKLSPDLNNEDHGFTRTFITQQPRLWKSMKVADVSKYIVGITSTDVYFSSLKPGQIEQLNLATGLTYSISVVASTALQNRLSASCQAEVNGPDIRLFDAPAGLIITGNTFTHKMQVHRFPELFTRFVSISPNQVFLRKFVAGERDQAFYTYDLQTEQLYGRMKLTEDKGDGGLSTDGDLVFDHTTGTLAYVEHNSNKITLFDTIGDMRTVAHSIDTFATNLFQTNQLVNKEQGTITNSAPVQFVNQCAAFDNNILYVQSGVRADNQRLTEFNSAVVIDRYDGKDGTYRGTILLEGVKDGMRNWIVHGQKLYLLRHSKLHIYNL